jgi:uncharacterized protein (DUF1015 family)
MPVRDPGHWYTPQRMADVRPFHGLRFTQSIAPDLGAVLSPPYDVIDGTDDQRLRERSPYNVVRVELTTASVAGGSEDRYDEAARTLRAWREQHALVEDPEAAYYLHEGTFAGPDGPATRRELIAAVRLEPWDRGVVLPHERTFPRAKADRLRLMQATDTNISPILVFFQRDGQSGAGAIDAAWAWATTRKAGAAGTDSEGVAHRLWVLTDPALVAGLQAYFAAQPLFIADGHHRYETALNYLQDRQERAGRDLPQDDPARFVLMHLIAEDDPGLLILPLHRLISGVGSIDVGAVLDRLRADFEVDVRAAESDDDVATVLQVLRAAGPDRHTMALVLPGGHKIAVLSRPVSPTLPPSIPANHHQSWRSLDVVLVDAIIVRPILADAGLHAEDALGYTRDAQDAIARVRSGEANLAVLVNPTRVEQIAAVALDGERMPEKSTYFFPKAPTGLVFHSLV